MAMKLRAIDLYGLATWLNPLDGPGTRTKPQVFNHVTQFSIALGGQFRHRHALLHVRVIALQLLELQAMARQRCNQFAKARMLAVQSVVAGVHLLALCLIEAQVERVAVRVLETRAEVLERLQPFEAR